MKYRFTIGLPITKTKFLEKTLASLDKQVFNDFEIVIKNNGVDEKVRKEIKNKCEYLLNRKNVKYSENKNQLNISLNFNSIIEIAEGEYFTILSDDDILHANFLLEFDLLIKKYPLVSIFHCKVKQIDDNGNLITYTENCPEYESQDNFIFNRITNKRSLFLSDFVCSTKELRKINGFIVLPNGWGIDEITWFRLSKNGIAFLSNALLEYRISNINFSQKMNFAARLKDIEITNCEIVNIIRLDLMAEKIIYPIDFLLDLNKKRKIQMVTQCMISYSRTVGIFSIIYKYMANKKEFGLPMTTFFRIIVRKIMKIDIIKAR